MQTFLGIEIGGTKLQLVLGNEQAEILERFRFTVDKGRGAEGIKEQIQEGLDKVDLSMLKAVGIGFGGPVDHATGKIYTSYQISGWGNFILRDWVESLTRVPVWIDNDANVAALGEALHGGGKNFSSVLYITLGSGVGAGLVIDKKIYHGAAGSEAEFGHIRLAKSGRTVESSCSGWAVDEKIRAYCRLHPESLLSELTRGYSQGEARVVPAALQAKDAAATNIIEETADDFSFALSHAVHLLNPHTVIIGGGLSLIGEPLRFLIEKKLRDYLMDVLRPGPSIQLSFLKEDSVPRGALSLAINRLASI